MMLAIAGAALPELSEPMNSPIEQNGMAPSCGDPDPLTARQREVLRLTTDGIPTADTARRLGLSAGTVRNYLSEAIAKLGAANRIEAARIARSKGWL